MIVVHRITHMSESLYINPDLIQTIEAHPDTVISLTTAAKFVVSESPEEVVDAIRRWRAGIVSTALEGGVTSSTEAMSGAVAAVVQLPVERR